MKAIARTTSVLVTLFALILSACAPGGTTTTLTPADETSGPIQSPGATATSGSGEATPGATSAPDTTGTPVAGGSDCGAVTLQYWNPFTGPDGPFMAQMVDTFNAEHPDIRVEMTSQGEYYTQLTTAAAADTLPDVAIVHADQVATQAFRNVLRPMDDLATEMGLDAGDYPADVWSAGMVGEQRYAIPLDIHPMTMFYNADMLAEAGIDAPPATREEFEAAAAAMTTGDNHGFAITGGFPVQQIFQQLLHQFGGTEFNEDGTEATWNSEAGVQALQWMKDAQAKYSEPNLEVDAELNAFKTGAVGMVWNGIWQIANVTGEGVEFDGRATAVPQIGPEMAVWAGSHQLTLPVHGTVDECKDQAAAVFIRYLVDNSATWARGGQIPASTSVRNSDEFKSIEPQASIAPSVEHAFFPPSVPGITDAFGPLGEAVGAVMNGTATDIKAALDDAATRANEILEQNRQTYGDAPPGQ